MDRGRACLRSAAREAGEWDTMSALIGRLRIMHRVVLALLVPSLGLALTATAIVAEKRATVADMRKLTELAGLATHVSGLVHEMQRERGAAAVFIGSKGAELRNELAAQRQLTDQKHRDLEAALQHFDAAASGGALAAILRDATGRIAHLGEIRAGTDALKLTAGDSNGYFTTTILRLLDVGTEISQLVPDVEIARSLSAYVNFAQAKERAGEERATGAPAFTAGAFDTAQYREFAGVVADESTYFGLFGSYASPDDKSFLVATVAGEPVSEVERMRKLALDAGPGGTLPGIEGPYWYKMTTARIDLMKKVEDHLAAGLMALADRVRGEAEASFWAALASALAVLAVTGVLGAVIVRGITRPVSGMTRAMSDLARGDSAVEIPGVGRGDEIGEMAASVQVFKQNMVEAERLRGEQEATKQRADEEKRLAMARLADEFEAGVRGIVEAVSSASAQLQATAQSMSATAEEASRQSTAVAAASDQASTNVQTVAAAADELSSSIAEIGRQVAESTNIAGQAVQETERTNTQIEGLAKAAQRIGDVVKLINDIAGQTNLLALNATIEAARAGDAGKGFAVVASEVKTLANQTAKATDEISAKISEMQAATSQSVEAVGTIGRTIGRVSDIAGTIAAAVEEQGAATKEIARNVQQASAGTADVSANIAEVTKAAGAAGLASGQVLQAAGDLSRQSEQLRTKVDAFIAKVRAA
jgi:methyl-accepting chemotaxis protein